MTEAARLEKLFERYKFTYPITDASRERLVESRERVFRSTLKELGIYSAWYAVILYIFFKLRGIGIKSSILAAKAVTVAASVLVACIVAGGTYAVYKYVYVYSAAIEKNNEIIDTAGTDIPDNGVAPDEDSIQKQSEKQTQIQTNGPISEIRLYNGKIYRGVILSRGKSYVINTSQGRITIPAKNIRVIKRVK